MIVGHTAKTAKMYTFGNVSTVKALLWAVYNMLQWFYNDEVSIGWLWTIYNI